MIVLSWNVRGLNNISREKVVRRLIESQSPDMVFIQETKLSLDCFAKCAMYIWPCGSWQGVGALNRSGGVACFWDPRKVSPLWWLSSRSSISLIGTSCENGERCFLSNIYAPTDFAGKV